jgi:hypothetical protein
MRARLHRYCVALGILLLLACAGSPKSVGSLPAASSFPPSGFLGDYSALRPGTMGRARLVFLDPSVDFSGYERVIVEPVVVWQSDEARFAGVATSEREALAREFGTELERAFGALFAVREGDPGPGTLRVRAALTAAIAPAKSADPQRLQFVEAELELLDAVTNQRLAAAVDSKGATASGAQAIDAGDVFTAWAEGSAVRVAALRDVDRLEGR